uniref:Uncharacterized protein n=1 Tax=Arundo donax TaxID=35708 RepID=A0A0A9C310_ARUDO
MALAMAELAGRTR